MEITNRNFKSREKFCRLVGVDIKQGCGVYLGFDEHKNMILCGKDGICDDCKVRLFNTIPKKHYCEVCGTELDKENGEIGRCYNCREEWGDEWPDRC